MWNKYLRLFNTVRFLRPVQIYYQLFYRLRKRPELKKVNNKRYYPIQLDHVHFFVTGVSFKHEQIEFSFLNISNKYPVNQIDWNDQSFGKLWTYNLNYFDYLNGPDVPAEEGLQLIQEYLKNPEGLKDGLEPFPISLRNVNWIKFLNLSGSTYQQIANSIYAQYLLLLKNLEYHLLGNHLLENAFSLFIGAHFFRDEQFLKKAISILEKELAEQILADGGHFELSPMYHQIMLYRLLDCYQISSRSEWDRSLSRVFYVYIQRMLGWLEAISFDGAIVPALNDSGRGVLEPSAVLFEYAKRLGIGYFPTKLDISGYRKMAAGVFEVIYDIGSVGPSYQPGHAHADTFSFELTAQGRSLIVDTGISTYEKNEIRNMERSTQSHNTISIGQHSSSDTWGGFRVGRRANVHILKEDLNVLKAKHDGYKYLGIEHAREFITLDEVIVIKDSILGLNDQEAVSSLHFHPSENVSLSNNIILLGDIEIILEGFISAELKSYSFAAGYNHLIQAKMLYGKVQSQSKIIIRNAY